MAELLCNVAMHRKKVEGMFVIPRVAVSTTTRKADQHTNRLACIAVTKLRSNKAGVVHRSSTDPAAADDTRLIMPS